MKQQDKTNTFRYTSSRGKTADFSPMPPYTRELLKKTMEEEGKLQPKRPTYTVDAAGDVEVFEHDDSTITTEEERRAWEEFKKQDAEWHQEFHTRLNLTCQLDCMTLVGVDWEEWEARMKRKGSKVPDDAIDKKLMYIRYEFIGDQADILNIVAIPSVLSIQGGIVGNVADSLFRQPHIVQGQNAAQITENQKQDVGV